MLLWVLEVLMLLCLSCSILALHSVWAHLCLLILASVQCLRQPGDAAFCWSWRLFGSARLSATGLDACAGLRVDATFMVWETAGSGPLNGYLTSISLCSESHLEDLARSHQSSLVCQLAEAWAGSDTLQQVLHQVHALLWLRMPTQAGAYPFAALEQLHRPTLRLQQPKTCQVDVPTIKQEDHLLKLYFIITHCVLDRPNRIEKECYLA